MSNKEDNESATVPQTPGNASLKKPSASVTKTAKVESRRVIPGRLDAFYKTLGAKRLTPRKIPDSSCKISRRRSCSPRWRSTNSDISRYKGRQSPNISRKRRAKRLPSVPKFSGPGKRIRVERCPSPYLQEKKQRTTKTPRSKRSKNVLNNNPCKSSDRLPKATNCFPKSADILRSSKPPPEDSNAAPGRANGPLSKEKPRAIEASATVKKAAIDCLSGTAEKREQQKLTRQLNTQIKDLNSKIQGFNSQLQELASQNENFQSENSVLQATILSQESTVEALKLALNDEKTKMKALKMSMSLNDAKLESKERECEDLRQRYKLLEKNNEVLKMKLAAVERNGFCFTRNDAIRFDSLLDKIPDFTDLKIFQKRENCQ